MRKKVKYRGMRRPPILGLVLADSWLAPYENELKARLRLYDSRAEVFAQRFGSLANAAKGYEAMGFNHDPESGDWIYREWAPGARSLSLIGDFNGWDRSATPLQPDDEGIWEVRLPAGPCQGTCHRRGRFRTRPNSRVDSLHLPGSSQL